MITLIYSLLAAFIVSLISLIGAAFLPVKRKHFDKILIYLVSFAAGGLLGGAFFHLLPEVLIEQKNLNLIFIFIVIGFCLFFILEKYLRWHHCHNNECLNHGHEHLGYLTLLGDTLHNVLDGIIIVSSFALSTELGFVVTITMIFHEIPQELGDYGVLIYAGFSRRKALTVNFLSGIVAVLGVLIGYFLISSLPMLNSLLVSLAIGGFIYIAAADFVPEIHKENKTQTSIFTFLVFLAALGFMLGLKLYGIE